MPSLGRDLGGEILARANFGAAVGAQATTNGAALDLSTLPARPESVVGLVIAVASLDAADTLTVDQVKLQSATDSAFTTPVDRVTASSVTLTEPSGTDVLHRSAITLALDLTQLPESHKFIRLSARHALSDTVNTSAQVTGAFVFGGLTSV